MREYRVSADEQGQRLDRFLRRRLPLAPASFIYRMLRKKNITLQGKKADGSEKVSAGDVIKLFLSEETIEKFSEKKDRDSQPSREDEWMRAYRIIRPLAGTDPVLYEDAHILLVCKPQGVLSQKAAPSDVSMNEWLRGYLLSKDSGGTSARSGVPAPGQAADAEGAGGFSGDPAAAVYLPSVCNRLDRNTGGILLCAKSLRGSRALSELIRKRLIKKTYRMLVHGRVTGPGTVEESLVKDGTQNQVQIAKEGGMRALTVYRPVRIGKKVTVVEADLITGRSHQLRVHMASIGHPIVLDPRYGDSRLDRSLFPQSDNDRRKIHNFQLLWCVSVTFPDTACCSRISDVLAPLAGRTFYCPPPPMWEILAKD